jgi:hypothetical protein
MKYTTATIPLNDFCEFELSDVEMKLNFEQYHVSKKNTLSTIEEAIRDCDQLYDNLGSENYMTIVLNEDNNIVYNAWKSLNINPIIDNSNNEND